MNHNNSPITARTKTRLVVSRGRISFGSGFDSERELVEGEGVDKLNFMGRGAKSEKVPVPVLERNDA